ncbi:hypothetical protein OG948_33550 [Embleya sp. NBC_00888]|uniref:hypothetical protein n=1 Tax=Embleya sp. NBC_00888 TaxID=2975960 RepID=UPI0038695FE8|nr:hypothetical protein OG948_33550 [Embleya sp. NBC_00888]
MAKKPTPGGNHPAPNRGLDLTVGRHLRLNLYVSPTLLLSLLSLTGAAGATWTALRGG